MSDKVAVVTGATSGIGRWIALGLAKAGYHVIMVGRDATRGAATGEWIGQQVPQAQTTLILTDLSSLAATRALAQQIMAAHPRISLLVNNAGVFLAKRAVTAEGHEAVLAINHLSPFVLTRELLPALQAAGSGRIVTVGSDMSDKGGIDPANLELTRGWNFVRAYRRSKLAQMMTTFALAKAFTGSGITANVVHPGAVATGLIRTPGVIGLAWKLMAPFMLGEEQGADTPLHVALTPELADTTGLYFKKRLPVKPNRRALDPVLVAQVVAATEALVG